MLSTTWTEKPTQRLLAAIAYKNGVIQTELAEWYGVQRRTIYSWLKRLDTEESLEQAVTNTHRSIKNWKLSGKEEEQSEATVHESPEEVGLDAPARTPVLVSIGFSGCEALFSVAQRSGIELPKTTPHSR